MTARALDAPTRPALRWHGGKWRLAPWIIRHFPPHRIYVEPFGGAASVLLRKARSYAEVYNDLDDLVVNLFRVLRHKTKAAALVEALRLTPFARAEFEEAVSAGDGDEVERARRLIARSFMGFGSNAHSTAAHTRSGFRAIVRGVNHGEAKTGLRNPPRFQGGTRAKPRTGAGNYRSTGFRSNSDRSGTTPAHDWANYPDCLLAIIDRVTGVVIEHRDAQATMAAHDTAGTLHYVDPPYLPETRAPSGKSVLKHRAYRHELSRADHIRLLDFLRGLSGMMVLSGYPAPLYAEALSDWRYDETAAHADGARPRIEALWLNPACAAALDARSRGTGTPLFGEAHL